MSFPIKKSFSRPDKYKDAMQNFFKKIVAAIDLHLDLEKLKCVLIASPGFVRDEFLQYILEPKEQNKKFTSNREKFVSGRGSLMKQFLVKLISQDHSLSKSEIWILKSKSFKNGSNSMFYYK